MIFYCEKYKERFKTYEGEFEGLSYTTMKENPFKNKTINIKNSEDDWNPSDYLYQNFGKKIRET